MSDLHERLRTLDYLPQPDLWSEIEARAVAAPARPVTGSTPTVVVVGILLAILGGAAIFASGLLPPPAPFPSEIPSQTPRESPPATPVVDVEPQWEWIGTGPMVAPRGEGHTVTLLGDGRVLVAGGNASGIGLTAGAELYDPETGTWRATRDMLVARFDHSATLLPDGRVLVAGGTQPASGGVFATSELYDPETETWSASNLMNEARTGHTATLLPDGRVLIAGGRGWISEDGGWDMGDLASAEVYDPTTGTWSRTTDMAEARDVSTATLLLDGRVLIVGQSAQLYDPASATWTVTGRVRAHGSHTATLLRDGRVLVAGGSGLGSQGAELYDPQANAWTQTGTMAERRAYFAAGRLPDGRVLVTGSGDGGYGGSRTAELYDPDTGTWIPVRNMLSTHGYHEGITLDDGRFLVVGGLFGQLSANDASAEILDVGGES